MGIIVIICMIILIICAVEIIRCAIRIRKQWKDGIIGTLYISFEEDEVPIYFASEEPIEKLAAKPSGNVRIIRVNDKPYNGNLRKEDIYEQDSRKTGRGD